MTMTFFSVIVFLALLVMLPLAIRWIQQRTPRGALATSASSIVSAIAVGPQQRVVTVEVGPEGARSWLVLGVTGQSISCLHQIAVGASQIQTSAPASTPAAVKY
jgi:flagellar protein FliO/FliZ